MIKHHSFVQLILAFSWESVHNFSGLEVYRYVHFTYYFLRIFHTCWSPKTIIFTKENESVPIPCYYSLNPYYWKDSHVIWIWSPLKLTSVNPLENDRSVWKFYWTFNFTRVEIVYFKAEFNTHTDLNRHKKPGTQRVIGIN